MVQLLVWIFYSFNINKNITINAGNSGTLARLILGMLVKSKIKIKD